jgi:hypothetical protein
MIAALEPLHEELERVSAHLDTCIDWLLTYYNARDLKLRAKRLSSKRSVVSFKKQEKRRVGIRNMAK